MSRYCIRERVLGKPRHLRDLPPQSPPLPTRFPFTLLPVRHWRGAPDRLES